MKVEELAKSYAEDNVLKSLNKIVEQAYIDGFNEGVKSTELSTNESFNIDGVEYVDLGLPSGTLWAKDLLLYETSVRPSLLPYIEASRYNLPTKEQFEELLNYTHIYHNIIQNNEGLHNYYSVIEILGINGKSITQPCTIPAENVFSDRKGQNMFAAWCKDSDNKGKTRKAFVSHVFSEETGETRDFIKELFMGLHLCVWQVKSNDKSQ